MAPPLSPQQKKLVKNITGLYAMIGVGLAAFRPLAGRIIINTAPDRATELVNVARHYPKMIDVLEKLVETNDIGQLVVGHGAMVFAILVAVDKIRLSPNIVDLLKNLGYEPVIEAKLQEAGALDAQAVTA